MTDSTFRTGHRVKLVLPTAEHAPLFCRWFNDPEVNRFMGRDLPMYMAQEVPFLETLHERLAKEQIFLLLGRHRNRWIPIGCMGLHGIDHMHGTATTGALIGEKRFWGNGYGSEAKILLLEYAFMRLNLRKICSAVYDFNERSRAYSERCGYRVEGVLRAHRYRDGAYRDETLLAVFREDFEPVLAFYRTHGRAPHRGELS